MTHDDLNEPAPASQLRSQIARVCVLGRYLIEALDLQQVEPSLREHVTADRFVGRTLATVRTQTARLDRFARAIPDIEQDFREPSASLAGLFMRFISKQRARALPDMIHNNQLMLRLASADYGILQELGTSVGDFRVAELARRHLDDLADLLGEMKALVPGSQRLDLDRMAR